MYLDDPGRTKVEITELKRDADFANKPVSAEFESYLTDLVAQQQEQINRLQARNKWLANRILDLHDRFHEVGVDLEHQAKSLKPIPGKKDILQLLYPDWPRSFEVSLCLSSPLASSLSKKKYIILDVYTTPHHIHPLNQSSTVSLVAELYSSHSPPRSLAINKKGVDLLIGTTQTHMKHCVKRKCYSAYFKLRVSEVTSHYMNGWIFIVIRPESIEQFPYIKPLILKNVVVSSRSFKAIRHK